MAQSEPDEIALSHFALRRGLGILGLILPVVLIAGSLVRGGPGILRSVSAYYYQPDLGQYLSGSLWAIGVFLLFYKGYSTIPEPFRRLPGWVARLLTDARLTSFAGAALILTAVVPTCRVYDPCDSPLRAAFHFAAAAGFLAASAILSFFSFTQSDTPRALRPMDKIVSNIVYRVCGAVMVLCIGLAGAVFLFGLDRLGPVRNPVFWLEITAIVAFAVSWLVKSEAIQRAARSLVRSFTGG